LTSNSSSLSIRGASSGLSIRGARSSSKIATSSKTTSATRTINNNHTKAPENNDGSFANCSNINNLTAIATVAMFIPWRLPVELYCETLLFCQFFKQVTRFLSQSRYKLRRAITNACNVNAGQKHKRGFCYRLATPPCDPTINLELCLELHTVVVLSYESFQLFVNFDNGKRKARTAMILTKAHLC